MLAISRMQTFSLKFLIKPWGQNKISNSSETGLLGTPLILQVMSEMH